MYKDCDSGRHGFESHHPIGSRMRKPENEKRLAVILRPADYDEWLHTKNAETARTMLRFHPFNDMVAEPK
ncbi:hypothetical protein CUJ89_08775 [Burkholderia pyrrocinia]|uniref:SOS response associated peptidase (SRAP) n=1 Tax=Burkholderia pyrrocinia TaxID=60550 RepID=A0A2Z5MVU6_BURPY|nr:hypothetical protein CUJ89_08775 [Burkholderia pyrrocinia]